MRRHHSARLRLELEVLEDRRLPSAGLGHGDGLKDLADAIKHTGASYVAHAVVPDSAHGHGHNAEFDFGDSRSDNGHGAKHNGKGGLAHGESDFDLSAPPGRKNGAGHQSDDSDGGSSVGLWPPVSVGHGSGGRNDSGSGDTDTGNTNDGSTSDGDNGSGKTGSDAGSPGKTKDHGNPWSDGKSHHQTGNGGNGNRDRGGDVGSDPSSGGVEPPVISHPGQPGPQAHHGHTGPGTQSPSADDGVPTASPSDSNDPEAVVVVATSASEVVSSPRHTGAGRAARVDIGLLDGEDAAAAIVAAGESRSRRDGESLPLSDDATVSARGVAGTLYSLVRDGRLLNWTGGLVLPGLTGVSGTGMPAEPVVAEPEAGLDEDTDAGAAPLPAGSGVLGGILPVDVAGLDAGLRKFVAEVEALGWQLTHAPSGTVLSAAALAGAAAALAYEASRRRRRRDGVLPSAADAETRTWLPDPSSFPTDG